jgi:uridylate kinase
MAKVVVKLSGSLFDKDSKKIKEFANYFASLNQKGVQPILVTGGGKVARELIKIGRELNGNEARLDEIGIKVARLNAMLMIIALKEHAYPLVPEDIDEALRASESGKVVVCGGFHPGHSTNAVAALLAEALHADLLINATDVDGVYTDDPRVSKDAKKIDKIKASKLVELLTKLPQVAGKYELMDLVAAKIILRSKIPARVLICGIEAINDAVMGKEIGTLIEPD